MSYLLTIGFGNCVLDCSLYLFLLRGTDYLSRCCYESLVERVSEWTPVSSLLKIDGFCQGVQAPTPIVSIIVVSFTILIKKLLPVP